MRNTLIRRWTFFAIQTFPFFLNALILDNIDLTPFYSTKVMESDLNETKTIQEFNKMEFCNHVCSLDDDILREVFGNLEKEINKLSALYNQ